MAVSPCSPVSPRASGSRGRDVSPRYMATPVSPCSPVSPRSGSRGRDSKQTWRRPPYAVRPLDTGHAEPPKPPKRPPSPGAAFSAGRGAFTLAVPEASAQRGSAERFVLLREPVPDLDIIVESPLVITEHST